MKTKTTFFIFIMLSFIFSSIIQPVYAAPPQVTNIRASQREGTKLVDITYDIHDPDGDKMYVWVEVSPDGGANYDLRACSVEGDVGPDIESGNGKHILWIAGKDLPGVKGTDFRVKVVADDTNSPPVIGEMALIPAGEFMMGTSDAEKQALRAMGWWYDWFNNEMPEHTVYLDAFYIDKYEVTNAQFAEFLNAYGQNTDTAGHELLDIHSGYCLIERAGNIYKPKAGYENHPVIEVSWYGAAAYAQFYGKRLPTEAEWEKAARGGLVGKRFPWGNEIDPTKANYDHDGSRGWSVAEMLKYLKTVGSFPPNGYGLYDVASNVWEWCADEYDSGYYSRSPENNPKGPGVAVTFRNDDFTNVTSRRVLRGGLWFNSPSYLRCATRCGNVSTFPDDLLGFRCSQDL